MNESPYRSIDRLPGVELYPFSVETTELSTNTTFVTYHKSVGEVHNEVSKTDEDIHYRCGWNRSDSTLICDSHKNEL